MSADSFVPEDLSGTSNRHIFFHRSESTTFLGCVSPDPIHTPLVQALPLAERPQLLHPLARREEMFGISKQPHNKSQVSFGLVVRGLFEYCLVSIFCFGSKALTRSKP